MILRALMVVALLALPSMAQAQDTPESIVAGLSQSRVAITANFDGSELLIYGAVKRETPAPDGAPLEVIVTVEGPSLPYTIRRKEWVAGIWINTSAVSVDAAPSFYAVATTGKLDEILSETEDLRYRITIPKLIRAVGIADEAENAPDFVAALERIRLADDRYRVAEGNVQLVEETLFRTDIILPANLTEGDYRIRIFLLRDGQVVDDQERMMGVRKTGLERFLHRLAHTEPFLYGLISLALAVVAGWAASAAFGFVRS